jgi:hypothetical protein
MQVRTRICTTGTWTPNHFVLLATAQAIPPPSPTAQATPPPSPTAQAIPPPSPTAQATPPPSSEPEPDVNDIFDFLRSTFVELSSNM